MKNCIYVAATSQHVGKTTCTLGLTASLHEKGLNVGYCKPVGQHFVELEDLCVDKDALLFSKVMGFKLEADLHSPVILGPGATSAYIESPDNYQYASKVRAASERLQKMHEMVIYEGTGHPGVGSVVSLSNADVAHMINAGVVMIVEGGIGSTIDRLTMCTSLFREKKVPIIGVILNKVLVDKIDKVKYFVGKHLENIGVPLLGVLPYDKTLSNPIMETINMAVKGRAATFPDKLDNKVERIIPGSLVDDKREFAGGQNLLLVVSHRRFNKAIEKIMNYVEKKQLTRSPLSGVIITGDGRHEKNFDNYSQECLEYINHHQIPVITTPLDTLGSMIKINRIEVKINIKTPWKAKRAIDMIRQHVNLDKIMEYQVS